MTVEEIFTKLSTHMIKGFMLHENLANYYDFLNLGGYKRCHEYHMMKEMCSYRSLCRYYINNYQKLIPEEHFDNPEVIPESWYKYRRGDVDPSTKRSAVMTGLTKWVEWERETKRFYQEMYTELLNLGEIASASKIQEFVLDVTCELKKAERYWLNKEATSYDMNEIVAEQKTKHDKYKKKLEKELHID